mmetsp:Transcript_50347/g.155642  ORF Transcript_50347/g.155642 Transcript_50347/m.155642 type:complete len:309 (+) Transcript_50347:117-1043(+)
MRSSGCATAAAGHATSSPVRSASGVRRATTTCAASAMQAGGSSHPRGRNIRWALPPREARVSQSLRRLPREGRPELPTWPLPGMPLPSLRAQHSVAGPHYRSFPSCALGGASTPSSAGGARAARQLRSFARWEQSAAAASTRSGRRATEVALRLRPSAAPVQIRHRADPRSPPAPGTPRRSRRAPCWAAASSHPPPWRRPRRRDPAAAAAPPRPRPPRPAQPPAPRPCRDHSLAPWFAPALAAAAARRLRRMLASPPWAHQRGLRRRQLHQRRLPARSCSCSVATRSRRCRSRGRPSSISTTPWPCRS